MRRLLSILITAALLLALAGCAMGRGAPQAAETCCWKAQASRVENWTAALLRAIPKSAI